MAFNYYTIDSIKQIDASDVPEAFLQYYQKLSEEMKEEIRDIRPDLVKVVETGDDTTDQETEQLAGETTDQDTDSEDDEEGVLSCGRSLGGYLYSRMAKTRNRNVCTGM